jgi:hypothetical protein
VNLHEKNLYLWLKKTIVEFGLCPFAKPSFDAGKIEISVSKNTGFEDLINDIEVLIKNIENHKFDTSIIALVNYQDGFENLYEMSKELELIFSGYQIVAFSKDFRFEGTKASDKVNLINSSPYPLLHVLPKRLMDNLNLTQDIGIKISEDNEKKIKSLSDGELKEYFFYMDNL